MESQYGVSAEALQFLKESTFSGTDRSAANLPVLRQQIREYMTPIVERLLQSSRVRTHVADIAGVTCLVVEPPELLTGCPVLYGFGGAFVKGSPFEDLAVAAPLCALTGARFIIPDYRLAPEHPWPAAIDDGFAVYRALADKSFALVGGSAGGNFALSLMLRARVEGLPLPCALALLSPWCDLSNSGESLASNDGRDPTLRLSDLEMSAPHYAGDNDVKNPLISPLFGTFDAHFPPCQITTGTRDLLLSQSVKLANALIDSGVVVDLHVWEGMWHVFEWDDRIPEARQSISRIAKFLSKHMRLE
ncbi:Putative acetyl-hydrolase LipR [Aliiroseovarius pelagivivens]|uniref:Acetyl-hydrolase LipR n=2 Tax=Aliiroseovarius pelagivivens TaxID=1639690 RepID=A0A2R8AI79_9RHOB|nr:Putative acetyl-hydrolase LipR [Aliiroseovarius pelagivivens]